MADSKLADLTADTTPADTDLLYVVADPAGTPADRKSTIAQVVTAMVLDEDNMASDSATKVPTQQSVKAYADTKAAVYVHDGSAYQLDGGRIFIGTEDPVADGYTLADGDQWVDPSA